jgi:hypothetical protein
MKSNYEGKIQEYKEKVEENIRETQVCTGKEILREKNQKITISIL